MPYLIKIGPIKENKSGVGSRGYHVYRRGRTVVSEWGPVDVVRSGNRMFDWSFAPQPRVERYASVQIARDALNKHLARRERNGYSLLPARVKILAPPKSR
jgi:hypothetical protein